MISREAAKELFDIADGSVLNDELIDKIYDSIGSCSECLYGTPLDDKSYIYCTRITNYGDDCNDASWFCADFIKGSERCMIKFTMKLCNNLPL